MDPPPVLPNATDWWASPYKRRCFLAILLLFGILLVSEPSIHRQTSAIGSLKLQPSVRGERPTMVLPDKEMEVASSTTTSSTLPSSSAEPTIIQELPESTVEPSISSAKPTIIQESPESTVEPSVSSAEPPIIQELPESTVEPSEVSKRDPLVEKKSLPGSWEVKTITLRNHTIELFVDAENPFHIFRNCGDHYRNQITYHEGWRGGLWDREVVLTDLGMLAQFLCARLQLQSPHDMLVKVHNDGILVSEDLVWSDYLKVEPFFPVEREELRSILGAPTHEDPDTVQVQSQLRKSKKVFRNDVDDDMDLLIDISLDPDRSFHWRADAVFLANPNGLRVGLQRYFRQLQSNSDTDLKLPFIDNNKYTQTATGDNIAETAAALSSRLLAEYTTPGREMIMGTWHIRRGDSAKWCDTSLIRLESFVNCSFSDLRDYPNVDVVVLIRTDERKEKYRDRLMAKFDRFHNVHAIELDRWINNQLTTNKTGLVWPNTYHNNYHLFMLEDAMLQYFHLQFSMEHRRNISCPDCSKVTDQVDLFQRRALGMRTFEELIVPSSESVYS